MEGKATRDDKAETMAMEVEEVPSQPAPPTKGEKEAENATNNRSINGEDSKTTHQQRGPKQGEEEDTHPKITDTEIDELPPVQTHSTHSRKSRLHGLKALPSYYQPCKEDVICAKGNDAKNHAGNQVLRSLIRSHLEEYKVLESRTDRAFIVSTIVNQIKKEGGRFVRRHKDGWADVGARNSREKIGASFRDLLHEQYSSSAKAKANRRKKQQCPAGAFKFPCKHIPVTMKATALDTTAGRSNSGEPTGKAVGTSNADTRGSANLATSNNPVAGQNPMLSRIPGRGNFPPSYMAASAMQRSTMPQHNMRPHHQVLPRAHLHHLRQTMDATTEAQAVAQAQAVQAARIQAAKIARAQQSLLQQVQAHAQMSFPRCAQAQAGVVPPPPPRSGGAPINGANGRVFAATAGSRRPSMSESAFAKLSAQFRAEAAAKMAASRIPPQEPEAGLVQQLEEEEEEEEEEEVEEEATEVAELDDNEEEVEEEEGHGDEPHDTHGDSETNHNYNGFSREAIAAASFLAGRRTSGTGGNPSVRNAAALAAASAGQPPHTNNPAFFYGAGGVSPEATGRSFFMPSAAAAAAMAAMQGNGGMVYPTTASAGTPRLPIFGAAKKRPSLEIYIRPPKHSKEEKAPKRSCMEPEGHYVGPKSLYTKEDAEDSGCASD